MKIVKPDNLTLLTTPCRLDGALYLSIGALACFPLDDQAVQGLCSEAELWLTAMSALEDGDLLDEGYPKPRGEFIVYGAALSRKPTTGLEITARVGSLSKTLMVTGDRQWTPGGAPGVPVPFVRMPVTYRNAFGGPGHAFNPGGKGFRPDVSGVRLLPNIQDPDTPLTSPWERPQPAGFCPYPPSWPQRKSLLGRFDALWLSERWPGLPGDASLDYFNVAPEDQRIQGFFQGDEQIVLTGMHAEKSTIISHLPGLKARIFMEQTPKGEKGFIEVTNRAETVILFPEAMRGIIVFRGCVPVGDEELEDINCIAAAWEALSDAPKPLEEHLKGMQEAVEPPSPPQLERPGAAVPPGPAAAAASFSSPELEELNREIEQMEAETDRKLQSLGMSREEVLQKYGVKEEGGETVSFESLAEDIEELEKQTDDHLKELGINREELLARYAPEEAEATPQDLSALQTDVRELLSKSREMLAASRLTEADFQSKLPDEVQGEVPSLEEAEKALNRWENETAQTGPVPAGEEPVEAMQPGIKTLSAAEVVHCHQAGEPLQNIDASRGDFTGCDLRGADFTEAVLDKACFANARLEGAVFSRAVLQEADFRGADLTGASFQGATGPDVRFDGARMTRADLSEGDWTGASLARADLHESNLSRAILRKADLTSCSLQGVVARETNFSDGNLSQADFTGGDLTAADFSCAILTRCILARTQARGLMIFGVVGEQTNLNNACLSGSRGGPGTAFSGADLAGADLTGSSLGGAQFINVDLSGAALDAGDFSRAVFERTNLLNATARETSFLKADFRESDMRGINLFKGSLRKAKLERTDLRDANLYGVDFFGASLVETDIRRSNLKRTLLDLRIDI